MTITNKKWNGITYQQRRKQRKKLLEHKRCPSRAIESIENAEYHVYFGRAHLKDFETNKEVRGYLKIGRGKFTTAIQRGRNQPGVDFRLYCFLEFYNDKSTWDCERIIKQIFSKKRVIGDQGQQELYDFEDNEIKSITKELEKHLKLNGIRVKSKEYFI